MFLVEEAEAEVEEDKEDKEDVVEFEEVMTSAARLTAATATVVRGGAAAGELDSSTTCLYHDCIQKKPLHQRL